MSLVWLSFVKLVSSDFTIDGVEPLHVLTPVLVMCPSVSCLRSRERNLEKQEVKIKFNHFSEKEEEMTDVSVKENQLPLTSSADSRSDWSWTELFWFCVLSFLQRKISEHFIVLSRCLRWFIVKEITYCTICCKKKKKKKALYSIVIGGVLRSFYLKLAQGPLHFCLFCLLWTKDGNGKQRETVRLLSISIKLSVSMLWLI